MERTQFPITFLLWLTFNRKAFLVLSEKVLMKEIQKNLRPAWYIKLSETIWGKHEGQNFNIYAETGILHI